MRTVTIDDPTPCRFWRLGFDVDQCSKIVRNTDTRVSLVNVEWARPRGPVVLTFNGGTPWRAWFSADALPSPPSVSRDHGIARPLDARTRRAPEPQLRSSRRCRSAHDQ